MKATQGVIAPCLKARDIDRFLRDIEQHIDVREIKMRTAGFQAEVEARGGKYVTQWSRLRHGGHPTAQRDREKLLFGIRDKILDSAAKAGDGTKPIAVIILGPPGSGKTSVAVPIAKQRFKVNFTSINPDDVKEKLPEYEGWNASALHEESSYLAERVIAGEAVARRHNLIYDIVGRSEEKVKSEIKSFHEMGYRVFVMLTDLLSWKAAVRAWNRFQDNPFRRSSSRPPGRFVPPEYVHNQVGDNPRKTFDMVKNHELVEGYCRLDVDVPKSTKPRILEQKGM
jgi:hypothetical protein